MKSEIIGISLMKLQLGIIILFAAGVAYLYQYINKHNFCITLLTHFKKVFQAVSWTLVFIVYNMFLYYHIIIQLLHY